MKHCDVCNIEIADNISHCPLCGKNILKNQEKITNQTFSCYPDNKIWSNNRNMIVNYFFWLLTIGTVICTILELVFFKRYYFSCYVLTGSLFAIFSILLPIKKRWCFSSVSTIVGISICAYLIFIELFTGTFGWGIMYTLPFFLLFMCIYSTSIIWSRNYYKGFEFIVPLLIFTILSVILFIVVVALNYTYWPSMVAMLTSIFCLVFVTFFRFKIVKEIFKKNFFI